MNRHLGVVGVVDDDPALCRALERLLRAKGYRVLPFATAEDCLSALDETGAEPDCLLVDLALPGLDGLGLQYELAERHLEIEVVFLTGHGDVPSSVEALKHGAVDFLEKPVDGERLLGALGEAVERRAVRRREREELAGIRARLDTLTPREKEVCELVVAGLLNKQVAGRLEITEGTVKVHRGKVMFKMQADSLAELVRMVSRLGIPSPSRTDRRWGAGGFRPEAPASAKAAPPSDHRPG
jgi:FixJ family two-component response regulator